MSDADAYLSKVHEICENERIDYFIPLIDPEVDLLNESRAWFEEHNVTLCISTKRSLDIIRNKKILQDFIKSEVPEVNGIPTLMVDATDKLPWEYPVVVKPYERTFQSGPRVHRALTRSGRRIRKSARARRVSWSRL